MVTSALSWGATQKAAADRDGTFDAVYREFAPRVRALASRRLHGRGLVDDVAQETFLRAFRAWSTFDTSRPVWPWLKVIATNVCTDLLRDGACWREVCSDDAPAAGWAAAPAGDTSPSVEADPADVFLQAERRRTIGDALAVLSPRQRRILLLRDYEGWCSEDVAGLEASTVDAVKSTLKRGRSTFRAAYLAAASSRGLLGTAVGVGGWVVSRVRAAMRRAARLSEAPTAAFSGPMQLLSATAGVVFVAVTGAVVIVGAAGGAFVRDAAPAARTSAAPTASSVEDVTASGGSPSRVVAPVAAPDARRAPVVEVSTADAPVPTDLGVAGGLEASQEEALVVAKVLAQLPGQESTQPVVRGFSDLRCEYSAARQAVCDGIALAAGAADA